jgi:hypothetical protein
MFGGFDASLFGRKADVTPINFCYHMLESPWLRGYPCFTPFFHPVLSDLVLSISIADIAPLHIFRVIFRVHSGKLSCLIVDMMSLCGTVPNAFVKSIVVIIKSFRCPRASCKSSFSSIPCSLHLFVFFTHPFWLPENMLFLLCIS